MTELLLVNSNMTFPSDASISGRPVQIRDMEKVVNLGLLSIASYLDAKGISLKIIDLVGCEDCLALLRNEREREKPRFVGISCISCFTYPKLVEYSKLIKTIDERIFVMAGGQHVSSIPQIAMEESPFLDCTVKGEGEFISHRIITCVNDGESLADVPSIIYRNGGTVVDHTGISGEPVDLDTLPFLKYDLYPNFQEYSPHVEVSRWCAFSCNFCTSGAMGNGISYKRMSRFVDELAYVKSFYGSERKDLRFFFACSTFGLQRDRIEQLIRLMRDRDLNILWRTETRADTPVVDYLEELVAVGLSVVDLGLEAGSQTMLRLMNKCKDPGAYLAKASKFIESVGRIENLLLKANLIFYPGETPDTVRETFNFLLDHSQNIDSISAGPVVLYAGTPMENMLPEYEAEYGTTLVHGAFWDAVHAYPVNPSAHFSFDQLNAVALMMSKMLCPEKGYFEVKKYGQFPLNMDLEDFRKAASQQEEHQLPYNFDRKAYLLARRDKEASDFSSLAAG